MTLATTLPVCFSNTIKMGGYLFVWHVVMLNLGDVGLNNECANFPDVFLEELSLWRRET